MIANGADPDAGLDSDPVCLSASINYIIKQFDLSLQ